MNSQELALRARFKLATQAQDIAMIEQLFSTETFVASQLKGLFYLEILEQSIQHDIPETLHYIMPLVHPNDMMKKIVKATSLGKMRAVKEMINAIDLDKVNNASVYIRHTMRMACRLGHVDIMDCIFSNQRLNDLIKIELDSFIANNNQTLFELACEASQLKSLEYVVNRQDFQFSQHIYQNNTSWLHLCCQNNATDILTYLFKEKGFALNEHCKCIMSQYEAASQWLENFNLLQSLEDNLPCKPHRVKIRL